MERSAKRFSSFYISIHFRFTHLFCLFVRALFGLNIHLCWATQYVSTQKNTPDQTTGWILHLLKTISIPVKAKNTRAMRLYLKWDERWIMLVVIIIVDKMNRNLCSQLNKSGTYSTAIRTDRRKGNNENCQLDRNSQCVSVALALAGRGFLLIYQK